MTRLRPFLLAAAAVTASACDDPGEPVTFDELEDGAVVGGDELTTIRVETDRAVVRTELYVDDLRIGAAEFFPFSIPWSTFAFDEGRHQLRGRAYLDDDTTLDGDIEIIVDHTPPAVSGLPAAVVTGRPVEIDASDANGLDRVELRFAGVEEVIVVDGADLTIPWPGRCGEGDVEITAVDRAGWVTTMTDRIQTTDDGDDDCDGYRAFAAGGDDCDDHDAAVHPGVVDAGLGADVNCDGVVGTDADQDGVASVETGGLDCDDGDPAVHPTAYVWGSAPLELDGQLLEWDPGTAAVAYFWTESSRGVLVAINRGGTIEVVIAPEVGAATSQVLVTGANPGRIAIGRDHGDALWVVYGTGNELRVRVAHGAPAADELVLTAEAPVEAPAVAHGYGSGGFAVAARAGTSIWTAIRHDDGWAPVESVTGVEVDVGPLFGGYGVNFVADEYLYGGSLFGTSEPYGVGDVSGIDVDAGLASISGEWIYAADGALMHRGVQVSSQWASIDRIVDIGEDVIFQARSYDGVAIVGRYDAAHQHVEYLDVPGVDAASDPNGPYGMSVLVAPGVRAWVTDVHIAKETYGDGIDGNCDGYDE